MSRARRLLAAAGTMVAVAATTLASPAVAADRGLIVELNGPAASLTGATAAVTGRVRPGEATLNLTPPQVDTISLQIVPAAGGAAVASTTQTPRRAAPVDFSWSPSITRNGNYRVDATATGSGSLGLAGVSGDASRTFAVAVAPRAPQQVRAVVNEDRTVTVSWARNSEVDMLGYRVFRSDPGAGAFFQVGPRDGLAHSGCAVRCEFRDEATVAVGGDYAYQILAFRSGPSQPIPSAPSGTANASVPLPTTTTGPPEPGAPVPGAGGPAAGTKPAVGSARGPAISRFLAAQPPPKPPPPPKILEAPDTGFDRELPFGVLPEGELEEPGEEDAVLPPDADTFDDMPARSTSGRSMVPVAAGLLLLVIAGHLRAFVGRTRPARGLPPIELRDTNGDNFYAPPMRGSVAGPARRVATVKIVSPADEVAPEPVPSPAPEPEGAKPSSEPNWVVPIDERWHEPWDERELDAAAFEVDSAVTQNNQSQDDEPGPRAASVAAEPLFPEVREPVRVGEGARGGDEWDEETWGSRLDGEALTIRVGPPAGSVRSTIPRGVLHEP